MQQKKLVLTGIVTLAVSGSVALADLVTFDLTWSGASEGNSATATGSVTIDTSSGVFDAAGGIFVSEPFSGSAFSDFVITVTGAASGNGTFSTANGDFEFFLFSAGGPLDLGADLIGQSDFYDFNIFTDGTTAPQGVDVFRIRTDAGEGSDVLVLTSMVAQDVSVVPLPPAAWAGLGLLGAMGATQRLRR